MAPRSNLKQCIRLLTSRLESTSEFIALNLVMKDEVLEITFNIRTHALLKPSLRLLYPLVRVMYHKIPYLQTVTRVKRLVFGKRKKTKVIGFSEPFLLCHI